MIVLGIRTPFVKKIWVDLVKYDNTIFVYIFMNNQQNLEGAKADML